MNRRRLGSALLLALTGLLAAAEEPSAMPALADACSSRVLARGELSQARKAADGRGPERLWGSCALAAQARLQRGEPLRAAPDVPAGAAAGRPGTAGHRRCPRDRGLAAGAPLRRGLAGR